MIGLIEIHHDPFGSFLAKSQVYLFRTDIISMTLNFNIYTLVFFNQPLDKAVKSGFSLLTELSTVKGKFSLIVAEG